MKRSCQKEAILGFNNPSPKCCPKFAPRLLLEVAPISHQGLFQEISNSAQMWFKIVSRKASREALMYATIKSSSLAPKSNSSLLQEISNSARGRTSSSTQNP